MVARIQEAIAHYNLTPEQLFRSKVVDGASGNGRAKHPARKLVREAKAATPTKVAWQASELSKGHQDPGELQGRARQHMDWPGQSATLVA